MRLQLSAHHRHKYMFLWIEHALSLTRKEWGRGEIGREANDEWGLAVRGGSRRYRAFVWFLFFPLSYERGLDLKGEAGKAYDRLELYHNLWVACMINAY